MYSKAATEHSLATSPWFADVVVQMDVTPEKSVPAGSGSPISSDKMQRLSLFDACKPTKLPSRRPGGYCITNNVRPLLVNAVTQQLDATQLDTAKANADKILRGGKFTTGSMFSLSEFHRCALKDSCAYKLDTVW